MIRTFFRQTIIPASINEVFAFFSQAENLNRITPPDLQFNILSSSSTGMNKGRLIDYKIKLHGFPMKWKTEITHWNPPYSFQDTQLKGPYMLWKHLHVFTEKENSTLMTDKVYYRIPGFILEPVIYRLFVHQKLDKIFNYREQAIQEIFKKSTLQLNN